MKTWLIFSLKTMVITITIIMCAIAIVKNFSYHGIKISDTGELKNEYVGKFKNYQIYKFSNDNGGNQLFFYDSLSNRPKYNDPTVYVNCLGDTIIYRGK